MLEISAKPPRQLGLRVECTISHLLPATAPRFSFYLQRGQLFGGRRYLRRINGGLRYSVTSCFRWVGHFKYKRLLLKLVLVERAFLPHYLPSAQFPNPTPNILWTP